MKNVRKLATRVLPWVLAARFLFGGVASADPAEGWAYCYYPDSDRGNYTVSVHGELYDAKMVKDRDTKKLAWHIEKEREVIGDDKNELATYATAAMTAQVAWLEDTHGVSELGQTVAEVLKEKADTLYKLAELNGFLGDLEFGIEIASQLEGILVGSKVGGVNSNYSELEEKIIGRITSKFMGDFERYIGPEWTGRLFELSNPQEYFEDKLEMFAEEEVRIGATKLRYAARILEKDREIWADTDAYPFLESYTQGHIRGLGALNFLKGINEHRSDWKNRLTFFIEDFVKGGANVNLRDFVRGTDYSESIFRLEPNTFSDFEREVLYQNGIYLEIMSMYNPDDPNGAAHFYLEELRSQ